MKITAIETIRLDEFPNMLWVHVHTDQGLVGLGETFYGPASAEGHIHGIIAPYLLGEDPRLLEKHTHNMTGYVGFNGSSAEQRGRSAVDIALWDLWGQSAGQPIHQMLGGAVRDEIRVYNTCAGYGYLRSAPVQGTESFNLNRLQKDKPYEDLDAFFNRADELAESLLEMGINGMKIWPFDFAAEKSKGSYISAKDLKKALEPFAKIRNAVGDKMDVMCELHAFWNLPMAKKICAALAEFDPLWIEDPVFMDQIESLEEVQGSTNIPIATGETLGGKAQYKDLLQRQGAGMLVMDIAWCGGITEARKVAAMADAWHVNAAFHDCTGPVTLAASTHLALHTQNCFIQEMVRAFYYDWYDDLVTALPPLKNGMITVPDGPGLGMAFNTERLKAADVHIRKSS